MGVLKLTDWFPGDVKPVRIGVYQRDYAGKGLKKDCVYNKWDGRVWYNSAPTILQADAETFPTCYQIEPWRGLSEEPK